MPPKPWEKVAKPNNSDMISHEIEQNNSQVTKMADDLNSEFLEDKNQNSALGTNSQLNNNQSSYSSYGMGSTYGSGGLYGGGMYGGSMYGGGMYGGGMYGGGMYGRYGGMGMPGMMGGMNGQMGNFQNTMQYLDSLGYALMSLTEIVRNLEMNADGLGRFWGSLCNLIIRFKNFITGSVTGTIHFFVSMIQKLKEKFQSKLYILQSEEQSNLAYKNKMLKIIARIVAVIILITLIPQLRNLISSNQDKVFEKNF